MCISTYPAVIGISMLWYLSVHRLIDQATSETVLVHKYFAQESRHRGGSLGSAGDRQSHSNMQLFRSAVELTLSWSLQIFLAHNLWVVVRLLSSKAMWSLLAASHSKYRKYFPRRTCIINTLVGRKKIDSGFIIGFNYSSSWLVKLYKTHAYCDMLDKYWRVWVSRKKSPITLFSVSNYKHFVTCRFLICMFLFIEILFDKLFCKHLQTEIIS